MIPRLDIKGPNLVKGVHLEGLRVLGKPETFARHYYENGADELIYIDVVASLYGRNSLLDMIKKTSQEIFIPLTVGGGLRTVEDIQKVLRAGADKVALNTSAINNPSLIKDAANKFGSSTIVVSIAAKKKNSGEYEAYTDNGREKTGVNVVDWAKKAEEKGAGEIYLMSIDRDGTGLGYDIELIKSVSKAVSIPVIAAGGAGKLGHFSDVIKNGNADAISMASILHYNYIENNYFDADYSSEGNIEFLKGIKKITKVEGATIPEIKNSLLENNISCRIEEDGHYDI
ncbi:MAG: imidazole glycerol phosphate synthase subunit HisF [Methanomicrobiaceae archaeon]|nr:imidazole glycerol phosphate synthase subunit HisF [Methanomicrobiaceae archaeon]